jgi:hypothetical protein
MKNIITNIENYYNELTLDPFETETLIYEFEKPLPGTNLGLFRILTSDFQGVFQSDYLIHIMNNEIVIRINGINGKKQLAVDRELKSGEVINYNMIGSYLELRFDDFKYLIYNGLLIVKTV